MAVIEFEDYGFFEVDFKNMRLIDVDSPDNILDINAMQDTGNGYEFYYDPLTKNMAEIPEDFVEQETGPYLVNLEYLTILYPHAMALAYGVSASIAEGKTDREFLDAIHQKQKQETSKKNIATLKPPFSGPRSRKRP